MFEIADLSKSYPGFDFGPVDVSIDDEVLAVLGPSGSGKSTLLSLVAGISRPDSGSISLDGRSLVGRPLEARNVGLVFQDGALFPHMTARENVAYAATSPGRVAELATMLEIDGVLDRLPASLSGGERQRVALARTLATNPDLLLLDEPLSSLDAPIRRRLRDAFHDLFGSLSVPVVYVTHDQRAATVLGDRIAVLHEGRVEQIASPSELLNRPESEFVARFTGCENVLRARVERRDDDGVSLRVGDVTIRTPGDSPVGATVSACIRPSRLRLCAVRAAPTSDGNGLTGTVSRRLNEGDEYRVSVELADADVELAVRARPSTVERLGVDPGETVGVSVPQGAVHVIERVGG
jgi:molybdate/tungstate transport system ATP-binding protein